MSAFRVSARWGILIVFGGVGCTALVDVDVTYCVPIGPRYAESFNLSRADLTDRCWGEEPAEGPSYTDDGDLVIPAVRGQRWSPVLSSTMIFRRMTGDFVVVARAEATSTIVAGHCLHPEEGAGLVVRRGAPLAWATLLVSPDFAPGVDPAVACGDTFKPPARVRTRSSGFGPTTEQEVDGVGVDAEALIAICRLGDQLAFYYRSPGNVPEWIAFHQQASTTEPVDVGLTVSGSGVAADDKGMEGHFPNVAFFDLSEVRVPDGCSGALATYVDPVEGK